MQIPEEILAVARDSALRSGRVDPMLFVHGTKGKVYMPLPFGKEVYLIPDGKPWGPWIRLEEEFDYKIDRYPLGELLKPGEEEGA